MKSARRFPTIERLEDRIAPASFLVTNLLDDNSPGSLRKAIAAANAQAGADTISFAKGLTGIISLVLGEMRITDALTIKGPGAGKIAIGASSASRIFNIDDGTAAEKPVAIAGLTLYNGQTAGLGGGILCYEPLKLSGVDILSCGATNSGGGLFWTSTGNLTIEKSRFNDNGSSADGGAAEIIASGGKVVLTQVKFANNSASGFSGGADVAADGAKSSVLLDRCTFVDNSSQFGGGAIGTRALNQGLVTVKLSTFTENDVPTQGRAAGALQSLGGRLVIQGSSFLNNRAYAGGAISLEGSTDATITSSLFFQNQLIVDVVKGDGGAILCDATAKVALVKSEFSHNTSSRMGGAIASSGGSITATGTIFTGNSAATDGGAIGATGPCLLNLTNCTFAGNVATDLGGAGGAVSIDGGGVTAKASIFSGNSAYCGGGAIYARIGDALLTNSRFTGNKCNFSIAGEVGGGAVGFGINNQTTFLASGCVFDHNQGPHAGALSLAAYSQAILTGNRFLANESYASGGGGGAVQARGASGVLTWTGGSVIDNSSTGGGGAATLTNAGTATITGVTFSGNHARDDGGALLINTSFVKVTGCLISENETGFRAAEEGGGIRIGGTAVVVIEKTKITGNLSVIGGGVSNHGTVTFIASDVSGNFALNGPNVAP